MSDTFRNALGETENVSAVTGADKVDAIIDFIQREADANAYLAELVRTNENLKDTTISVSDAWEARRSQCEALVNAIRRMS